MNPLESSLGILKKSGHSLETSTTSNMKVSVSSFYLDACGHAIEPVTTDMTGTS